MATAKKLRYSLDEDQHLATWETGPDPDYNEAAPAGFDDVIDCEYEVPADPDYDDAGQPTYDEPAPADPDYGDEPAVSWTDEAPGSPPPPAPAAGFTYALGQAVRPLTQQQAHPVVWQGYLKERHPTTGLVQRVPVYQLRDGFWDCYREDELQAA
ncbi:hypothetical protein HHL22_12000 [Hymenobacter sp. RP-2-7]|uniref:Uncharacterized protein n=1 Tax=Hymenobacter polaris TaxID=2682546 RepID=A0A7Y0AEK1_9BACT|nr:hypothetical protein [Hymenobacter polaris]NML65929.1 hypothetical protein [Hymenobacter polaris]